MHVGCVEILFGALALPMDSQCCDWRTNRDVVLIFGRETSGLPADLHARYADRFVALPIVSPHVRSLNLSTTVGIAVYDVLRRRHGR